MLGYIKKTVRRAVRGSLLQFSGGIGDDLLCTAVAHEMFVRGYRRILMVSRYADLFHGNHDLAGVVRPESTAFHVARSVIGWDQFHMLSYERHDREKDISTAPREHIIAVMCRQVGLEGTIRLRPYAYPSVEGLSSVSPFRGCLAVQSSGKAAQNYMPNKEWYPERFAEVSRLLMKEHMVIQVGSDGDPPLPCHVDCRGRTSLRQMTALLSVAALFIGQVGFLMHLARAVDCPAVIVYGGREAPALTGYDCNVNLYTEMHCSPCWRQWTCEFERKCMAEITVDHVVRGVRAQLEKGRSLPVEDVVLF
jgi:hypothetical protein